MAMEANNKCLLFILSLTSDERAIGMTDVYSNIPIFLNVGCVQDEERLFSRVSA